MKKETVDKLMTAGIGLAILWAAYKYMPFGGQATKAAILGVAGVVVANQVPYVSDALKA